MDAQIKLMKEELEMMDQLEPNAEMIKNEVCKPKSELDASILKYQIKNDAMQDTILKFLAVKDIDDPGAWLKGIRGCAEKQFKSIYKLNRLKDFK